MVEIPVGTLKHYIQDDVSLRRTLGAGVGKPSIIDQGKQKFLVDVVKRRDRGNDGMSTAAVVDALGELLRQAWRRTVRPGFKSDLTGIIRAQATTTKRTAITKLRERNVGCCPNSGKAFGEVRWGFLCIIDTVFDCGSAWLVRFFVGATSEVMPTSKWPRRGRMKKN
ncbi:hypothetical protein M885DRAFT_548582 [Pelagophyceae sp. CCMP2097]|nr:hypothetical protein M885DRAFT_548582 [Pelagophyceae sp. CCMP2097]